MRISISALLCLRPARWIRIVRIRLLYLRPPHRVRIVGVRIVHILNCQCVAAAPASAFLHVLWIWTADRYRFTGGIQLRVR